jgi:DNA-binding transcriptional ArsR family regulator
MKGFDPVIHPPARLQIMGLLGGVSDIAFDKLRELTGVTDSVMSKHLSALSEAGYVKIKKLPFEGRSRTWIERTTAGQRAFKAHFDALRALSNPDQR